MIYCDQSETKKDPLGETIRGFMKWMGNIFMTPQTLPSTQLHWSQPRLNNTWWIRPVSGPKQTNQ